MIAAAAALTGVIAGCSTGRTPSAPDWSLAIVHFEAGDARSPAVYDRKDASRCVGRWRLHADALDDGAFPPEAYDALPRELLLDDAISSAKFFLLDVNAPQIMQSASDEAETRLRAALGGDAKAFQLYFETLGLCDTNPEAVSDPAPGAMDEAATG